METFQQASRIASEIQENLFSRLDFCTDSNQAMTLNAAIEEKIAELQRLQERADMTLQKANTVQRSTLKFKCEQMKQNFNHIKCVFRTLQQRRQFREKERRDREELLTRRFVTNEVMRNCSGNGDAAIQIQHQEYYDNEKNRLQGLHSHMDDLLATGTAAINNIRNQGSMLRGTRARIMEVGSTLGLSNSVMRLIEKRILTDKFILFGGMIILTVLMFLIWKFLT